MQFAKQGFSTKVLIGCPDKLSEILDADVCVINSESRALSEELAYQKVKEISRVIKDYSFSLYYKKIDSTLRGNISAEVEALMYDIDFDYAVVVPAYPKNLRLTMGGYHYVDHRLIEDSEFYEDPKFSISGSYIPDIFKSKSEVVHFGVNEIRRDKFLSQKIKIEVAKQKKIFVFDCVSDDDFSKIIKASHDQSKKILWVGSAGLMSSLSCYFNKDKKSQKSHLQDTKLEGPYLIVAGSVSATTRAQVEYLEKMNFHVLQLDPINLLKDECHVEELSKWYDVASRYLDNSENVVITTENSEVIKRSFVQFLKENQMTQEFAGKLIAQRLGSVGSKLITNKLVKGVFLTGGDIAYQTCYQLNLKALQIIDEVEEGIPLCRIDDQNLPNIPFVTKAGAFGNQDSIYKSILKMATIQVYS